MKATKELMTAAVCKLEKLNKTINELEERTQSEGIEERVEKWILEGWSIDLELARKSKDTLENWMMDLEFDI